MSIMETVFRQVRRRREQRKVAHLPDGFAARRVIDIGCGLYPFPESVFPEAATFYADYDPSNNPAERLNCRGTFCRVDVENLPFADKAFDFVHCSNVLEHVSSPAQGFHELQRIAHHGYIECPSAFRENVICHTGAHKWIVEFTPDGVATRAPRETRVFGMRVLPMTWLYWTLVKARILWKLFDLLMGDCLGLMYRHHAF